MEFTPGVLPGVLLQYPDERGEIVICSPFIERAHAQGVLVAVGDGPAGAGVVQAARRDGRGRGGR